MKHIKPYFTGICILIFALIIMLTDIFGWFQPNDSLSKGIQFFEQNNYVKAADNFSQAVRLCEHISKMIKQNKNKYIYVF
ncbi:hypothetical protein MHK_007347 [Candidatus Magnetomorum sp. HK-1]|nr:hypothetical protein MHK_007347 [Candidatus Magnetomorum sp. HK-1]